MADAIAYELLRFRTRDGGETTVYLVRHPLRATRLSLVCFDEPTRLDAWCVRQGHREAIVAGFFVRDPTRPLGEVRLDGEALAHEPVAEPWRARRACVHIDGGAVRIAYRDELLAVCCDGRRSGVDAGLDLGELARLLISFGAREAINLDGGGSATLVHRGHLLNRPYSNDDQPSPESRPVVTALLFD